MTPKWVILEAFLRPFWAPPGQGKYANPLVRPFKWANTGSGPGPEGPQIGVQKGLFDPYLEAFLGPFWAPPGQGKYGVSLLRPFKWARTGPEPVPEWLQKGVILGVFGGYLGPIWGPGRP